MISPYVIPGIKKDKKEYQMQYILDKVCNFFCIDKEDVLSWNKKAEVAYVRAWAIYLIKSHTDANNSNLSILFDRDRSTIISSLHKISKKLNNTDNNNYKRDFPILISLINKTT